MSVAREKALDTWEALKAQCDWPQAFKIWDEYRKQFPLDAVGYAKSIKSLIEWGKLDQAEELIDRSLGRFSNVSDIEMCIGEISMRRGNWSKANSDWIEFRSKFPSHPTGFICGIIALRQNGKLEEANNLLSEALKIFPNESGILAQVGELLMFRKQWNKAIQLWANYRERFPKNPTGYFRGISALIKTGEIEAAESLLEKGLALFPNELGMIASAGELAMIRSEWGNAIIIWKVFRRKFSKSPLGYAFGIKSLIQANQYKQAEKVLKKGIENKIELKESYDRIDKLYLEAHDWVSSLRLMVDCDPIIQIDNDWRNKINKALDSKYLYTTKLQEDYNSYAAIHQAMRVLIQIKKWINWNIEQIFEKLFYFLEESQKQHFTKPSLILEEIICKNNKVYLRDGTLRYTNADDLLILLQELLANENYWFQSSTDYPVIIDCGTHFGLSLYYYKKLYPNAKIVAFEPNPQLFEIAKENISHNQWTDITLIPFAISAKCGIRKFHIPQNGNLMAGSLLKRLETSGYEFDTIDVRSQQLSKIVNEPVDFLKLDIEGAELEVLKEMKAKLLFIQNIFCEFHEGGEIDSSDLVTAMEILDSSGFKLRMILSPNYSGLMQNKPLAFLNQRCSSELWGTRLR